MVCFCIVITEWQGIDRMAIHGINGIVGHGMVWHDIDGMVLKGMNGQGMVSNDMDGMVWND